jgi:hypothetical protein
MRVADPGPIQLNLELDLSKVLATCFLTKKHILTFQKEKIDLN